jgi:uncharacterized membrane protein YbaN (DUF454 family)
MEPSAPRPVLRWFFQAAALLFLLLGLIGVVVPGMPTTVFILLAAWAAARGSPRLHGWLMAHRLFGPMLRDWRNGGTVSRRAKWSATATMLPCAVLVVATARAPWLAALAIACMAGVLAWLWRRPESALPGLGGAGGDHGHGGCGLGDEGAPGLHASQVLVPGGECHGVNGDDQGERQGV